MLQIQAKIQNRCATANQWLIENPILLSGEVGYEIDTGRYKLGDNQKTWKQLDYVDNNATVLLAQKSVPASMPENIQDRIAQSIKNLQEIVINDTRSKEYKLKYELINLLEEEDDSFTNYSSIVFMYLGESEYTFEDGRTITTIYQDRLIADELYNYFLNPAFPEEGIAINNNPSDNLTSYKPIQETIDLFIELYRSDRFSRLLSNSINIKIIEHCYDNKDASSYKLLYSQLFSQASAIALELDNGEIASLFNDYLLGFNEQNVDMGKIAVTETTNSLLKTRTNYLLKLELVQAASYMQSRIELTLNKGTPNINIIRSFPGSSEKDNIVLTIPSHLLSENLVQTMVPTYEQIDENESITALSTIGIGSTERLTIELPNIYGILQYAGECKIGATQAIKYGTRKYILDEKIDTYNSNPILTTENYFSHKIVSNANEYSIWKVPNNLSNIYFTLNGFNAGYTKDTDASTETESVYICEHPNLGEIILYGTWDK